MDINNPVRNINKMLSAYWLTTGEFALVFNMTFFTLQR
jgi:hypothetical protein